jgi:hypothetical protein
MESTTGDPVNLRPNEMSPSLPPTQEVVDIFANTTKILEGQNLVLSQLVQNVIHNRYQGLSQTSLSNSLSQAISQSIMEQVYLFNLLMNHEAQNQQNQDSNQQLLDSLMSPSQLPMDLREEERRSKSHKRDLPKIDLNGWEITCTELPSREKKPSNPASVVDQPIKTQWVTRSNTPTPLLCFNCREPGHFVRECPKTEQNKPNPHGRGSRAKQGSQGKRPKPQVKQSKHNFTGIHFYFRTTFPKLAF